MSHEMRPDDEGLRITAVADLSGLNVHTIRAWERRYGVPSPPRSTGRQRLYTRADVEALRRMRDLSQGGMPLANAARVALRERGQGDVAAGPGTLPTLDAFVDALLSFDEPRATELWTSYLGASDLYALLSTLAIPALHRIGDGWHAGEVTVGQEHFASALIRGRLDAMARQVSPSRNAPTVMLACLPDEWHELGVLMLHVLLRYRGLRSFYLGQSVPLDDLVRTAEDLQPRVLALHGNLDEAPARLAAVAEKLSDRAPGMRIVYGGHAFEKDAATSIPGARFGGRTLAEAADIIESIARQPAG